MEIRMKTLMVGPSVARQPGETCVVTAEEGEMLVRGGYAEALGKPAKTKPAKAEPEMADGPAADPAQPALDLGAPAVSGETADAAEDAGRKKGGKH